MAKIYSKLKQPDQKHPNIILQIIQQINTI